MKVHPITYEVNDNAIDEQNNSQKYLLQTIFKRQQMKAIVLDKNKKTF